jgi:hypothetical protein
MIYMQNKLCNHSSSNNANGLKQFVSSCNPGIKYVLHAQFISVQYQSSYYINSLSILYILIVSCNVFNKETYSVSYNFW